MKIISDKVLLPIELLSYIQQHKLVKAFTMYMYLKCTSTGKINQTDDDFIAMPKMLGIEDRRTLKKYLRTLLELNWIGYNSLSGDYFIRGIGFIRKQQGFRKRTNVLFFFKDIDHMQAYVAGSIISCNINRQKYFWEVVKGRRLRSASMKMGSAQQDRKPTSYATTQKPDYYGLGVDKIGELLFCKHSRACELKHLAEKAGYIKTRRKFRELEILSKSDHLLRARYAYANPCEAKKIRFKKVKRKGKNLIAVIVQLHDEVMPKMEFKRGRPYSKL